MEISLERDGKVMELLFYRESIILRTELYRNRLINRGVAV